MISNVIKVYKLLIIANTLVSVVITYQVILYNIENFDYKIISILLYGLIWFFSLYKIYNFSKIGLKLYLLLVLLGFVLNILSDPKSFDKIYYIMSLFEHLVIGAIISLSYFSSIKNKYNSKKS